MTDVPGATPGRVENPRASLGIIFLPSVSNLMIERLKLSIAEQHAGNDSLTDEKPATGEELFRQSHNNKDDYRSSSFPDEQISSFAVQPFSGFADEQSSSLPDEQS